MTLTLRQSLKQKQPAFFWNDAGYITVSEHKDFNLPHPDTTEENIKKFGLGQLLRFRLGQSRLAVNEEGLMSFGVQNGFGINHGFNPAEGNGLPNDAVLGVVIDPKCCLFGKDMLGSLEEYESMCYDRECEWPETAVKIVYWDDTVRLWIF